jgi:hypothetical protein
MVPPRLDELLAVKLPWLSSEYGFQTVSRWGTNAGSVVVMESRELRLRFVLEYGRIFAQVASLSAPETWWAVPLLCEAVTGERPVAEVQGLGPLLLSNLRLFIVALGSRIEETRASLDRIMQRSASPLGVKRLRLPMGVRIRGLLRQLSVRLLGATVGIALLLWLISR